jgi:hypothetical protein
MITRRLVLWAVFFATAVTGMTATAAEFPDGTIVVSDNWCAPNNDNYCDACNSGRLIVDAWCHNSYCDNMIYQCNPPPIVNGQATALSGNQFIANSQSVSMNHGWTSDEFGANSANAVCPVGYAMVGMVSTGNYSDNIRTICSLITRSGGWTGVTLILTRAANSISDEPPYNYTFRSQNQSPPSSWLNGASCNSDYCDNMFYWYTTISS